MAQKENEIQMFRQYGAVHRKTKRSWELWDNDKTASASFPGQANNQSFVFAQRSIITPPFITPTIGIYQVGLPPCPNGGIR